MRKYGTKLLSVLLLCMLLLTVFAIGIAAEGETSAAVTTKNTDITEAISEEQNPAGATDTVVPDESTASDAGTGDTLPGLDAEDAPADEDSVDLSVLDGTAEEETVATTEEVAGEESEEDKNPFVDTIWALLPPVIAIGLALITKEVYSSLFAGIVAGALLYANFNLETAYNTMITDGFISSLSDSWNVGILIFLVVLGIIVILINRAGGSTAYGEWAGKKIRSRTSAILATFGLGCLIFVDDYFNCLTVGSVMRPITDTHHISRAKLAYIIDATAAPVCMIAPISSWAAAVSGVVEGTNGFTLFCKAIPYNFYSLLTIVMIITMTLTRTEFGPMKKHETNAIKKGDIYTTPDRPYSNAQNVAVVTGKKKGKVVDLVLPIVLLIVVCILGMVYTGNIGQSSITVPEGTVCVLPEGSAVITTDNPEYSSASFDTSMEAEIILNADFTTDGDSSLLTSNTANAEISFLREDLTLTLPAMEENDDGEMVSIVYHDTLGGEYQLASDTDIIVPANSPATTDTVTFIDAFANCDASAGLSMGSLLALLLIILYMICRRVLSFKDCMEALPEGFKSMVPAILILTFAWTLSRVTGLLGAAQYVSEVFDSAAGGLKLLLPAIVFLVAVGLSFATGTSWGTFGILIPIVVPLFHNVDNEMLIIAISACLAGAVCGDHCSPISDTTIMASTGGQCNHINHVSTQLPYALSVAAVSFVSYIIAGFVKKWYIVLPIAIILMVAVILVIRAITGKMDDSKEAVETK